MKDFIDFIDFFINISNIYHHSYRKEVFSGTISAYTQNFAANNPGTITSVTPGWDPDDYLFNLCSITSGVENGALFRIAKNLGGGSARVFPIMKNDSEIWPSYVTAGNIPTSTFKVWQQTRCGPVNINGEWSINFYDIEVVDDGYFSKINTIKYLTSRKLSTPLFDGQRSYIYMIDCEDVTFSGIFGELHLSKKSVHARILCESLICEQDNENSYNGVGVLIQGHGYDTGSGWTEGGKFIIYNNYECGGPFGLFDSTSINKIYGFFYTYQYSAIDGGRFYGTNANHVAAQGNVPIINLYSDPHLSEMIGGIYVYGNSAPIVANTYPSAQIGFNGVGEYLWTQIPLFFNAKNMSVVNGDIIWAAGYQNVVTVGFIEDTDENVAAFASPINTLIGKLYINARVAPGAGESYTIEVNVNGAPQITLALTEANTTASSSTIVRITAGQRVTFKATATGGSAAADITVTLRTGI